MKKLFVALCLLGLAPFAQAKSLAAPLWTCRLDATVIGTQSALELLIIRGETVSAKGVSTCVDLTGRTVQKRVNIEIQSGGLGPAINGPLQGLTIFAVRAGVATLDGMVGSYQLSAGPRLGVLGARASVMGGVQVSGEGVGAGIDLVIENRFSIGLDLGGMSMTVTEDLTRRRR